MFAPQRDRDKGDTTSLWKSFCQRDSAIQAIIQHKILSTELPASLDTQG